MPNVMAMEVVEPESPDGIYTSDVRSEDGWAIPGDKPGIGIEINQDALAKATVETVTSRAGPSAPALGHERRQKGRIGEQAIRSNHHGRGAGQVRDTP